MKGIPKLLEGNKCRLISSLYDWLKFEIYFSNWFSNMSNFKIPHFSANQIKTLLLEVGLLLFIMSSYIFYSLP